MIRWISSLAIALKLGAAIESAAALELVSISPQGVPLAQSYNAIPSANGRFILFSQDASPDGVDGGCSVQWLLRDRLLQQSEIVSTNSAGQVADCNLVPFTRTTSGADVSADGRYVVFDFRATNLVATPNDFATYLKDRQTGQLSLLSVSSGFPLLDDSGRYVLFERVVPTRRLIRLDRNTGSEIDVVGSSGFVSLEYALSADGNRIAYAGVGAAQDIQIFVFDVAQGVRYLASDAFGVPANGRVLSPALDADGSVVVFESEAQNLNGPAIGTQIIRRVLSAPVGEIVSRDANGVPAFGFPVDSPSVSGDGNLVAFRAFAMNLPGGDAAFPFLPQVFVFDHRRGIPLLVSSNEAGAPADFGSSIERCEQVDGGPCSGIIATSPRLSTDGTTVAFHSFSTNLSSLDPDPGRPDVYAAPVPRGAPPAVPPTAVPAASPFGLIVFTVLLLGGASFARSR